MDENGKTNDLEMLEEMRDTLFKAFKEGENVKVGDLLKIIELKRKLSVEGKGEKKFWEMVNEIRREELSKLPGKKNRRKGNV